LDWIITKEDQCPR